MPPSKDLIVTRFAPSPTGHLHIGGARSALFCWAFARRHSGVFLLRIEDTDQARSSEASARGIMADLAWLGIDWDEGPTLAPEHRVRGGAPVAGETPGNARSIGADPRHVGPFFQSQRMGLYDEALARLIEQGKAYYAFETPAELDAKRKAATAAGKQYRYDRASLEIPAAERNARAKGGEPCVVRFLTPDDPVTVVDEVLGEVKVTHEELDDFVIRKADGFPTYHFGVVVDDELMGVTHVLRGQEHLYNTPKHVALQKALGYYTPAYAHMPLIFNEQGAKMSKRERDKLARTTVKQQNIAESPLPNVPGLDTATFAAWMKDTAKQLETNALESLAAHLKLTLPEVSVDDFRRAGFLPEVITNFIALLGWSPPAEAGENVEKFDLPFLAKWFDLSRIGKTNAKFDRKKLLAFNTDGITALDDGKFACRWWAWCEDNAPGILKLGDARFMTLAAAIRPRCKTFLDAAEQAGFAMIADDAVMFDAKAAEKNLKADNGAGLMVLRDLRAKFAALSDAEFTAPNLHGILEAYAAEKSLGLGKIAQPLRVALTGSTVSPPIDATLAALGKTSVIARIDRCVQKTGAAHTA